MAGYRLVTGNKRGVLVLAATPIGDIADASSRLRQELADVDIIAAEDTRRARRLIDDLDVSVSGRLVSYYDAVERTRLPELIEALKGGQRVLLITDAGMPSVSDPGYRLVAAAVAEGIHVTAAPGPSAVLTALALSGLPVDRFAFEGFLPRKAGERSTVLAELASDPRTLVFFEAPHRITEMLTALADSFGGDRPAAVCRELTKTYEEVRRGGLRELAEWSASGLRGEITVVVQGAPASQRRRTASEDEDPRKAALAAVAQAYGIPRKAAYDAIVAAKKSAGQES